ncbi:MAG: hypothetical protein GY759_10050 [Chloroflexi bacterium]|nr:hypothetical protein [Chloroflexota bacterium]
MTTTEGMERLVQREARSPRSAALAGILFSLLIGASMILLGTGAVVDPTEIDGEWLEAQSSAAAVVLVLIPFAGIAFLWFTGVMRDLLGELEDKFFATVFLGSGIILVVMMFVWTSAFGAMFGTYQALGGVSNDFGVYIYAISFANEIMGSYFLRMASVYMLSIGSLWTRTKVVPRWLTVVTYIVAVPFLLFAGALGWARFLFPAWVLMVSIFILILNFRHNQEREGDDELTLEA